MKPPAPRGQALVVGAVLILVALVPLTWGLTGVVFGVGLPFSGPVLVPVRLGLLLVGLVGLAIGARLVQDSLPDERSPRRRTGTSRPVSRGRGAGGGADRPSRPLPPARPCRILGGCASAP